MNVIQVLGSLAYGDGVGNIVLLISRLLTSSGIPCRIITARLDKRIDAIAGISEEKNLAVELSRYEFSPEDIVIHHYSGDDGLGEAMAALPCKKILVFHNVTSPAFFKEVDMPTYLSCLMGHDGIKYTAGRYLRAIVLSDFSKGTLVANGWSARDIDIFPLYEPAKNTERAGHILLPSITRDGWTNILFTGRISPNKKIEDIIRVFEWYRTNLNERSRLILVGTSPFPSYRRALDEYVASRRITGVTFAGHVTDAEKDAYYEAADVFLCMSEHEGFCIPLLEAFQRRVPVVAYRSTAVPDTMGDAGVIVDSKDPQTVCGEIEKLVKNPAYRAGIIEGQLGRLKEMTLEAHKEEFLGCLARVDAVKSWEYEKKSSSWLNINIQKTERPRDRIPPEVFDRLAAADSIVLYGIGKTGRVILESVPQGIRGKITAICDNGYEGDAFMFRNISIPVYNEPECLKAKGGAIYLISVQKGYLRIIRGLLENGVPAGDIYFYDNARKRVEAMA